MFIAHVINDRRRSSCSTSVLRNCPRLWHVCACARFPWASGVQWGLKQIWDKFGNHKFGKHRMGVLAQSFIRKHPSTKTSAQFWERCPGPKPQQEMQVSKICVAALVHLLLPRACASAIFRMSLPLSAKSPQPLTPPHRVRSAHCQPQVAIRRQPSLSHGQCT
jgi:hypothetical protein